MATETQRPDRRLVDLTAADVMSVPVVTVSSEESLGTAWNRLVGNDVRHLVVTREGRYVAGIIDDRRIALEWPLGPLGPHRRRVRDLVSEGVHCVLPDTPVRVVASIMTRERLDAVPVVQRDGTLVGIVTATDLVALVSRVPADR